MFADPAKDRTFKLGDEVEVNAVLVDPVLNTMIRGLNDTSHMITLKDGCTKNPSFDPTVAIADSSGKIVAEGTMPFG